MCWSENQLSIRCRRLVTPGPSALHNWISHDWKAGSASFAHPQTWEVWLLGGLKLQSKILFASHVLTCWRPCQRHKLPSCFALEQYILLFAQEDHDISGRIRKLFQNPPAAAESSASSSCIAYISAVVPTIVFTGVVRFIDPMSVLFQLIENEALWNESFVARV